MATKWQLLELELATHERRALRIRKELEWMESTKIDPPVNCNHCNEQLSTEAEFARHFIVPDPRLKNIGYCPRQVVLNVRELCKCHVSELPPHDKADHDAMLKLDWEATHE